MKYKIKETGFDAIEKSRVEAILKFRANNGDPLYKEGLEAAEIAQLLVGTNSGRRPSGEYTARIEKLLGQLLAEGIVETVG